MAKNNITNILLLIVVILLVGILLQGKIRAYFKSQEVLNRVNVFNIPDVAVACYKLITDEVSENTQACNNKINQYSGKEIRWKKLINEYRNINCKDFVDKHEANEFYSWISGELTHGFYVYRNIVKGKEPDTDKFAFESTSEFNGQCHYDPYGLDSNGDCNACESYGISGE